ncbi:MAG: FAD-binding oxidoreductase [Chitinophagales bacterium]
MTGLGQDLTSLIKAANVKTETEDLMAYTSDAIYYMKPTKPDAIVLPESTEEVSKVLKYAYQHEIPIVPRGAGSGLAGGCTPVKAGIVLDMKRMNNIIEIDRSNMTATVEPGVVLANFHKAVEKQKAFYPPDPQSMSVCTLGGNIATRAGGPRGVKYGTTSNYVLGMEVVLPDGSVINAGGKYVKQSTGYDITHLMTGSEGTLGVITKANLRLIPLPPYHRTILVVCDSLDQAAELVSAIIGRGAVPAMLEFLVAIAIVVMNNYIQPPLPIDAPAYLLMELDGSREQVDLDTVIVKEICGDLKAREIRVIEDEKEAASYWIARSKLYPLMTSVMKRVITEDVTIPRNRIPEFVRAYQKVTEETGARTGIAGHAGDGNMHPTILMDQLNDEVEANAKKAIDMIIRSGLDMGGTISGEHGIGLHKSEYLPWELGDIQVALLKRIKQAFDPRGIMNPGKIWPE